MAQVALVDDDFAQRVLAEQRYEELWRAAAALVIELDYEGYKTECAEPLRRILEWRR